MSERDCGECGSDCTRCGEPQVPESDIPLTFARLQAENKPWADHNWPDRKPHQPLLGAAEEIGELCHAHLKSEQGIRGSAEKHHAAKIDAVADVIVFLADYCNLNGIDMQAAVEQTWAEVKQRDWQKNKQTGAA